MLVESLEIEPMKARRSFSRIVLCSVIHLRRAAVAASERVHGCSTHNLPSSTKIPALEDDRSLFSQDSAVSL